MESGIGIEKVNLYGVPEEKQQSIIEALKATNIVVVSEGAGKDIQFFPKRLDRTKALDALFNRLGISFENAMALGDSELDVPAMEKSAIGVAMGNSPDWVKQKQTMLQPHSMKMVWLRLLRNFFLTNLKPRLKVQNQYHLRIINPTIDI